ANHCRVLATFMMGGTELVRQREHRPLIEVAQLATSEDGLGCSLGSLALLHTMHQIGQVVRKAMLSRSTP
ncbi:hypothetical protein RFZ55_01855, partial [Acinetobacter baumannii]|nr:hypothetical protein [Acinetobacter baumannii]